MDTPRTLPTWRLLWPRYRPSRAQYAALIRASGLFDAEHYIGQCPEAGRDGVDPVEHFLDTATATSASPHPLFDTRFYLGVYPDVAAAGINPLVHWLLYGAREGRRTHPLARPGTDDSAIPSGVSPTAPWQPPNDLLPWFSPLALEFDTALRTQPAVNFLLPGLGIRHMSGGPNTALHLAYRLAVAEVRVRLIAVNAPLDPDTHPLWTHILGLTGARERPRLLEIWDGHDRKVPFHVGENDLFFATAWWTAQMAKYACRRTRRARFLYLIQDYEPLLHPASTPQALASETYALDHVPIVNSGSLLEYLIAHRVGRFADRTFADAAITFEPSVDRSRFYPERPLAGRPRRLLFYTRPTNGLRNLFELGVAALLKAVSEGVFEGDRWEILGIGESFTAVPLGNGLVLSPAPWLDFDGYAAQMRQSDVLLSLMLSPHPSYPPLEMAACGGQAVTTVFATKSAARLAEMSPNLIGAEPTIEGIADAIREAVRRVQSNTRRTGHINLPADWDTALAPVAAELRERLFDWWQVPDAQRAFESRCWPASAYDVARLEAPAARALQVSAPAERGLISFVTPVWNTDPHMLRELAARLLADSADGAYEWIVLDNGSTRQATLSVLRELESHASVRVHRAGENLGIIRGSRRCLELARNRYAAFVDHDDLVAPDCARVLSDAIVGSGYPPLLYTDEDKLDDGHHVAPYFKPDWDPVLFANSCYTAHLSVFDRRLALELGTHTDRSAEGSHDWDAFVRFMLAGHTPVHVPEVLYTWRLHESSTAADLAAKPYVIDSQRAVLQRLIAGRHLEDRFDVIPSPLLRQAGNWWIRRRPEGELRLATVRLLDEPGTQGSSGAKSRYDPPAIVPVNGLQYRQLEARTPAQLLDVIGSLNDDVLVHLLWDGVTPEGIDWPWEVVGLFELFTDAVMVGGRIHHRGQVLDAGAYFGMGRGCDSPDVGRRLDDPGYFSQHLKPHSVSAVPLWHFVGRRAFLMAALHNLAGTGLRSAALGPWLAAQARRNGQRVIYSPILTAQVPRGWMVPLSDEDHALFRSLNEDLVPERHLLSPRVGLTPTTVYEPVPTRTSPRVTVRHEVTYPAELAIRERSRSLSLPRPARPVFSVITTVYSGSDGALLEATAASIVPQLRAGDEWIVLAQGPLQQTTERVLSFLTSERAVSILRRPENLGIVPGMRVCLEAARGDYVCPVDGDDLITSDALTQLAHAIVTRQWPTLVYSDEDMLADRPFARYARPDFDPVLNGESSYVWHLCAFDRKTALTAGVYSDPGADYTPDWDAVTRLASAGTIVHVSEVLYHWRKHSGSSTHTDSAHPGSAASVRHVLEQRRAALPCPHRFEIAPFPMPRGASEPYLKRRRIEAPAVDLVRFGSASEATVHGVDIDYDFQSVHCLGTDANGVARLREVLAKSDVPFVACCDASMRPSPQWIWEAVRLMELYPRVGVCGGRVLTSTGMVGGGCLVFDRFEQLVDPFAGRVATDPGPFALALKPHQVAAVGPLLFVADASVLKAALAGAPRLLEVSDLGIWLSAHAWAGGRQVAYSPLLSADGSTSLQPAARGAFWRSAERALGHVLSGRLLGLAGFITTARSVFN